jgi:hypothetical protein
VSPPVPNINIHLEAIYEERELSPEPTIKFRLMLRTEGGRQLSRKVRRAQREQAGADDLVELTSKLERLPRSDPPAPPARQRKDGR